MPKCLRKLMAYLYLTRIWFFPLRWVKSVYKGGKKKKPKELCFFQLGFELRRFSWRDIRHVGGWRRVRFSGGDRRCQGDVP